MLKHPEITERRIARALELLKPRIWTDRAPLRVELCEPGGEPAFPPRLPETGFREFHAGQSWGPAWSTTWFRFRGAVPAEWRGRPVSALVRLGYSNTEGFTAEGLVWRDGRPERAINVNRADVPISAEAAGGEQVDFLVEAAANPVIRAWAPYPKLGGEPEPAPAGPLYILEQAELACFDPNADALYTDLRLASEAMLEMPEGSPRRGRLLAACNDAVSLLDFPNPATYPAAREALREVLAAKNGSSAHEVSAMGHAHIDTAWLWPLREAIRKCARTFSTQLAYLAEHPGYVFSCSQAQHYAWMKEYYPHIYDGIREAIRRGQWEPAGSMWVEADCNLPSGESLVRQLLHGKNFFLDEFGIETRDCLLPDVFGFSGSLPQILARAGVDSFLTQKISWNQFNSFPHHTFWWEGIDGSRVFAHFPPSETYNGEFSPRQLAFGVRNFKEHDRATRSLYPFGYGDGGGGPTREMLETARRLADFEGLPRVTIEGLRAFIDKARADARDLPVWVGEIYLELHRGTYTSQARNKKGNRKSENLLREAEFFDVLAGRGAYAVKPGVVEDHRAPYDVTARHATTAAGYLERAWKLLLLNQFHDIIPGSSIARVHQDSISDYAAIFQLAHAVMEPARHAVLERIGTGAAERPVVAFNASGVARNEIVSLPDGTPIHAEVPPCGYAVLDAAARPPVSSFAHPVELIERKRLLAMDNGMLRVIIDRVTGNIRSIRDHRRAREVLAAEHEGNVFQLLPDLPNNYDAWEIEPFAFEKPAEVRGLVSIDVAESGDLRTSLRIQRRFGSSSIIQHISLCAGSPRIDFATEVDWQERHALLKVAFPVNVRAPRAAFEVQFGHVERPTHCNTSWDLARFEVPAQKWADLSEGDYGVALLNDSKHGYDIHRNVIRLSLLRGPTAPDAGADIGAHDFVYSLLPHLRDFRKGGVVEAAQALNMPLQLIETDPKKAQLPARLSFIEVDRPGVIVETVKRAERDESVIIRLYEANGARGPVLLTTKIPFKYAFKADLMERTGEPLESEAGHVAFTVQPFEIVTLKLI